MRSVGTRTVPGRGEGVEADEAEEEEGGEGRGGEGGKRDMVLTACGDRPRARQRSRTPMERRKSRTHPQRRGFALVERADRLGDEAGRVGEREGDLCREERERAVVVLLHLGGVAVRDTPGSRQLGGSRGDGGGRGRTRLCAPRRHPRPPWAPACRPCRRARGGWRRRGRGSCRRPGRTRG